MRIIHKIQFVAPLTADNFAVRLRQDLTSKNDIAGFVKNTDYDE